MTHPIRFFSSVLLVVAILCGLGAEDAVAAESPAPNALQKTPKGEPLQVYADGGMEWLSENQQVIAEGNAKAVRGDLTITADKLVGYYREGPNGNEFWRLTAEGNVIITRNLANAHPPSTQVGTGVRAVYDLDKAIFVLYGSPARLVSPKSTITAMDGIEYWENDRRAVARGKAKAIQKAEDQTEKIIESDTLTALFKEGPAGGQEMSHADAYGNVVLTTPSERVTGERGDYDVPTGVVTISGKVKVVRDGNELNGGYARVNLNTGISKLFGTTPAGVSPGKEGGRVQGTFIPSKDVTERRRSGAKPPTTPPSPPAKAP